MRIHRVIAEEKEITLHEHLAEIADQRFDPYKIAQVIDNLISNAVKFSPHGSSIHVTVIEEDTVARVSVRDEGPGIPKEDMERIFGDFQRLRTKTTAGEKSTGLGLAIAKRIIDAHRGTLTVESEGLGGTTFSFTLSLGYDTHGDEETKSHNC
jgi:two-component system sensor histidine kinase/response regulator